MAVPVIQSARTVPVAGAACAGSAGSGVEFFSTEPGDVAAARSLCARCPVQLRCLAGALARDEQWGVWGGWVFEPRTVRARVLPAPLTRAVAPDAADVDGAAADDSGGAGWLVRTTDRWDRRRVRGWFATRGSAEIAADRWEREGRWRKAIGIRFAAVLAGLVPDQELHGPTPAISAPQRKVSRPRVSRRNSSVTVDGSVDGRMDQLIELLITKLGTDDSRSADSPRRAA